MSAPVGCFLGLFVLFPLSWLLFLLLFLFVDGFEGVDDHLVKSWKLRLFHYGTWWRDTEKRKCMYNTTFWRTKRFQKLCKEASKFGIEDWEKVHSTNIPERYGSLLWCWSSIPPTAGLSVGRWKRWLNGWRWWGWSLCSDYRTRSDRRLFCRHLRRTRRHLT